MLRVTLLAAAGTALMQFAAPASAETLEVDSAAMSPSAQVDDTVHVTAKMPASLPRSKHILGNEELDEQRGGEQLVIANQTLTAITQGNVLNGDFLAGDVNLSDSALSGFNGMGNILINTGAQVSLQAGMNMTINMTE